MTYFSSSTGEKLEKVVNSAFLKDNATEFIPTGAYNPATKKYVDDKVDAAVSAVAWKKTIVDALPATGEDNTVYLIKDSLASSETKNVYTEYVWITPETGDPFFEALGTVETGADMSNYLGKDNTEAFTPVGDYNPATKVYVDQASRKFINIFIDDVTTITDAPVNTNLPVKGIPVTNLKVGASSAIMVSIAISYKSVSYSINVKGKLAENKMYVDDTVLMPNGRLCRIYTYSSDRYTPSFVAVTEENYIPLFRIAMLDYSIVAEKGSYAISSDYDIVNKKYIDGLSYEISSEIFNVQSNEVNADGTLTAAALARVLAALGGESGFDNILNSNAINYYTNTGNEKIIVSVNKEITERVIIFMSDIYLRRFTLLLAENDNAGVKSYNAQFAAEVIKQEIIVGQSVPHETYPTIWIDTEDNSVSGMVVEEAPMDGGIYVRQNGAWVNANMITNSSLKINLVSSAGASDTGLNGAKFTITYTPKGSSSPVSAEYTWNGTEIVVTLPYLSTYSITIPDVAGYTKPSSITNELSPSGALKTNFNYTKTA